MQQVGVDDAILGPISIFQQRGGDQPQPRLIIRDALYVNRQSVQYLADFLRGDGHEVTELRFHMFHLLQPSDGGLNVLCDLFANNITLTKVKLDWCNFGSVEEASQLIAAIIQTSRSVTDLTFYQIANLRGAALGNCISGVLQSTVHLQRLDVGDYLSAEAIRAFQPNLRSNRNLKELCLSYCDLGDSGIGLIVDALVGNTTMEIFDCSGNEISFLSIADITRLVEFTQLKSICAENNNHLFANTEGTKKFISVLRQHTSLEKFQAGFDLESYPCYGETAMAIDNIMTQNVNIRRAKELLALQPRTGLPIGSKSGIWYMAMAKMAEQGIDEQQFQSDDEEENGDDMNDPDATVTPIGAEGPAQEDEVQSDDNDDDDDSDNGPDAPTPTYPGASAIFKIFQTRPAIIEKQLRRPTAAVALQEPRDSATTKHHDDQDPTGMNGGGGSNSSSLQTHGGGKRQRTL